jgi:hypothetical protein
MSTQLTAADARDSLSAHVAGKGAEVFAKYGPSIGWPELQRLIADPAIVRYPCEISFDAGALEPGEFAIPIPKGERPEDGFIVQVHPIYMLDLPRVAFLVLYQLVAVNYGPFASADDAEIFGASALGLSRDDYYEAVCEMADRLGGAAETTAMGADGGASGCGCG